ncbi:MAG: adenylate/guanylate cyclase domain-containing protein, partial [Pseudomonadota bacterium]
RLGMIAMAAAVLVMAARRTQALLRQSIDVAVTNTNLTRFLPQQLAPRLGEVGLDALRRGRREDVGVLFIDIRGFTRLTETMAPAELASFATEFRTRIVRVADATDGIVDKFMGDAAMILFPAGENAPDAARRCLRCAGLLKVAMADWSDTRENVGLPPVSAGIGAHFGEVFSGVVGDASRLEFSVFGDAVNVASRLEDLTKDHNTDTLVSRAIVERACDQRHWRSVATLTLRGRDAMIDVMAPAGSDP